MRSSPALAALACAATLSACTPSVPTGPATAPAATSTAPAQSAPAAATASPPAIVEPTTTNTLPPPPEPTGPAPSTAGRLTAAALPVPAGWRSVALPGGDEEGYLGNGTWVHARDPRYAAQAVASVGCADVTRDDYRDPVAALEGSYRRGEEIGVGLVLEFADAAAAASYFTLYRAQIEACEEPGQVVETEVLATPTAPDGGQGLVDRRTDSGAAWTEVVEQNGPRLTLIILGDADARITAGAAQDVLDQIRPV